MIDSRGVKGAEKRGARIDPPGYDAGKKVTGKKVTGKKRHLLVDLQDRDGALLVLDRQTRRLFPFLETIFADGAYGGEKLRWAMAEPPGGSSWSSAPPRPRASRSSPGVGSSSTPSPVRSWL